MSKKISFSISLLAIAGIGIMGYLTYIHYANTQSFCDLSETISCDVVTTSIYSEIFGIPVSLLGMGYFLLIIGLIARMRNNQTLNNIFLLTVLVLIPSLYLSLLEVFVIKAFCILCETSKILMIGILISAYIGMQNKINMRIVAPVIIAGLLATGITYFAQTGTVTKTDNTPLAQCLNDKGVVYYKSVRCSNCKRQEKLFGEAYKMLNSVECHPDEPDGNPQLCLQKKVDRTPTFILEPQNQEIKRLEGLQPLEVLADFAGCERP